MRYAGDSPGFLFRPDTTGRFVARPNRFIIEAQTDEGLVRAHCANPGRLTEILLPETELILERASRPERTTRYTAVAALHRGEVVPLVSAKANQIAATILPDLYPNALDIRPEFPFGGSRFDFLVDMPDRSAFVEVKSCTLCEFHIAMFPDAPTDRGRRHVYELAHISAGTFREKPVEARTLFIITHGSPRRFMPHIHTDPEFSIALRDVSNSVSVNAYSVKVNADGSIAAKPERVPVEIGVADIGERNAGVYLVAIEINQTCELEIGALGLLKFPAGWYVYAGSAKKNLRQRTTRHKAKRKRLHWHIDYLTSASDSVAVFPVMTGRDLECRLSDAIARVSDRSITGFGASDCNCPSHLHFFKQAPLSNRLFVDILLEYRHVHAFGSAISRHQGL